MNCKKKYPSKSYLGAKFFDILKVTSIEKEKYDTYQIKKKTKIRHMTTPDYALVPLSS